MNLVIALNQRKIFSLMFIGFTLFSSLVYSQQSGIVTGKVSDSETREAIIGASVKVKGSTIGTVTDINGEFRINASNGAILQISYIGYLTIEREVTSSVPLNIILTSDSRNLEEVVVVGYGTQRKATLTGSVSQVSAKTFENRGPIASPLAALQGQAPGVTVTRSSAQPGRENWNFQVRGATSVNGTEPLVIVDGLPIPNLGALNSFNPADIESISFLKDASASIYGARAAGGVVLITTKKAKTGKAVIDYNFAASKKNIGLQPHLVDIAGWGPMMKEARTADGFASTDIWNNYADMAIYAVQNNKTWLSKAEATALGYGTNFTDVKDFVFFPGTMQDVLWGNATSSEHQLSVAGRGEKAGYRVSLAYLNDGSLLQVGNNENKRYNLRLVNDYQVTPKFKVESNLSLEMNNIFQPTGLGNILNNGIQPGLPLNSINGKPYVWGSGLGNATVNNIADLGGENKEYNSRINTNFNLTYNVLKNLKAVGSLGYYFHNTDYRTQENLITFYDYSGTQVISNITSTNNTRNAYQRGARRESYYNLNGFLEWAKVFKNDHDFKAMLGAQYERDETNRFLGRTLDVVAGVPPSLSNSTATDAAGRTTIEAQNHYALSGYFSRFNYSYKNKYLFETNARYDGSSKFAKEDRWKLFYGFLGAWRVSEEKFMENISFVDELKVRASWGKVGNQSGIDLYDYLQLLNFNFSTGQTASGFPIIGTSPVVRVAPGNLVALDRTWEEVQTANLGLDYSLLKNRLYGTFDYFVKQNKNMLIARTFPAVIGATAPRGNNGELETKGWELGINWRQQIGGVSYHVGGNLSDSKNELVNFGGQKLISSANQGFNSAVEGYPINSYFGLEHAGRIQTQEQLDAYKLLLPGNNIGMPSGASTAQANARLALGDNMFNDINGDGKITFPEDAKFLGTDDPRYSYSFNAGAEWKGFDFNIIFQGVGKRALARTGNWRIPAQVIFQAQNNAFYNEWWTPTRTDANLPRISTTGAINNYNYHPSDWVIENASYLRLKNLVIGYTIPKSITDKAKIQRMRMYFSGNDLWENSHIKDGWDPEALRTVANEGDPNNNNIGTFSGRYPFYRYITFGANVTF
ncbi:TonB-dependent receptor [Pedobacter sp. P351]|uniref:SusC/RagA family TonB-linked outer membrane protein n=1 Tax=Pedobacter superstes TaxID=3133441 RepID=UPI00309A0CB6